MLDRLGDPSTHNVIILHGSPGVGKSELAREFARRHRNRYPGGTFLIEAGTNVAKIDLARIGRVFLDLEFPSDFGSMISAFERFVLLARRHLC